MNIILNSNAQTGMTGSSGLGTLSGIGKTESAVHTDKTASDSAVIKAANLDRVELSDTAVQYLNDGSVSDSDNDADVSETAAASVENTVSEIVSESNDVLASELYSYTETELQELMLNGTITRSEYEAELEKRSGDGVNVGE